MKKIGNFKLKILLKKLLLFSFFSLVAIPVVFLTDSFAAQFQLEMTPDRSELVPGETFILNLRISGDEDFTIEPPSPPHVDGLEIVNSWTGPKQSSSSMSVVNGKAEFSRSISQDFNYQMSPQKSGIFLIPGFDVSINGKKFRTNPVKIEANEKFRNQTRSQPKKNKGNRQIFPPGFGDEDENSPFGAFPDEEDLFSQLMKQRQKLFDQLPRQKKEVISRQLDVDVNDPFFVYLDLDKSEVYEGEQITARWSIYTKGSLESLDRVKFPDLRGVWKEIIEEVPSLQFYPEQVNGVLFQKALLASHALFPIKAGQIVIDEFKVKGKVRVQSAFGWGQSKELTKQSLRRIVKVLPLPQEGRTELFSGAVGNFQISAHTDGETFPANQPFSIKVRFEGMGNAKLIELPSIKWPDGLEVFDTKSDSKFNKDGLSYKEFEILVVPRREGQLTIEPIKFSYFDPKLRKYVTEATESLDLYISKGTALPNQTPDAKQSGLGSGSSASAANPSSDQVRVLLELPQSAFVFRDYRLVFYGILALLISIGAGLPFARSYLKLKVRPGLQQVVESKLQKIEKIYAELPKTELSKGDEVKKSKQIAAEAVNVVYLLAAQLAGQKKANQEWSELIKEIPKKSQGLLDRLTELFDYFQLLGFSPNELNAQLVRQQLLSTKITDLRKLAVEIVKSVEV